MTTLDGRLKILEQRLLPSVTTPATVQPFDHDAYRAWWQETAALPPEELATLCVEELAQADWPSLPTGEGIDWRGFTREYRENWIAVRVTDFDWPEYARVLYASLARNPSNWGELVAAAEEARARK
ncbi:MAG: hypothetical protein ACR2QA_04105 [Solirubrobacteraceae bacterium]